jgi:hypothetical protein
MVRAITSAVRASDPAASSIMRSWAHGLIAEVSAGVKAVEVPERQRQVVDELRHQRSALRRSGIKLVNYPTMEPGASLLLLAD